MNLNMARKLNLITGEIMKKIISFILGCFVALNLSISVANSAANEVRVAYFLEWPSPNLEDMMKKNFATDYPRRWRSARSASTRSKHP